MIARLLPLVLLATSCAPPTALGDVEVASARLSELTFFGFGVLGAAREGTATLEVEDKDGTSTSLPVRVTMGIVGGLLEAGAGQLAGGDYDVAGVSGPMGTDLLGAFDGFALNGAMMIGGGLLDVENERHVRLGIGGFEAIAGMSLLAGHAWVNIDQDDGTGEVVP